MVSKVARKRQFTARELAEKWNVHPSTVRRHVAQPRAEYLAESLMRARPWEALGMSRATWYRKGKPAVPDQDVLSETQHPKNRHDPEQQ